VYNIKAAAEATGLPPATLRAWERRYGALSPSRTEGGYRLYSERDIAHLRWLKERIDEGMTISQAMVLWRYREIEPRMPGPVTESSIDLSSLRQSLVAALTDYDESEADRILAEAFAVFGVETVSEGMIVPAMVEIGERWHNGRASTASEHFASNYLRRKIESLISAGLHRAGGPLIVLGCAPDDWHELGLLLIYLFLQRRGYDVLYLGQNVGVDQFAEEMRRLSPALVVISATTENSIPGVRTMAATVQAMDSPRPVFGFGGSVFNACPHLRSTISGVFMGENAREALTSVGNVLSERRK
jgi:methanogenic corrinoid protein MtbC1